MPRSLRNVTIGLLLATLVSVGIAVGRTVVSSPAIYQGTFPHERIPPADSSSSPASIPQKTLPGSEGILWLAVDRTCATAVGQRDCHNGFLPSAPAVAGKQMPNAIIYTGSTHTVSGGLGKGMLVGDLFVPQWYETTPGLGEEIGSITFQFTTDKPHTYTYSLRTTDSPLHFEVPLYEATSALTTTVNVQPGHGFGISNMRIIRQSPQWTPPSLTPIITSTTRTDGDLLWSGLSSCSDLAGPNGCQWGWVAQAKATDGTTMANSMIVMDSKVHLKSLSLNGTYTKMVGTIFVPEWYKDRNPTKTFMGALMVTAADEQTFMVPVYSDDQHPISFEIPVRNAGYLLVRIVGVDNQGFGISQLRLVSGN